MADAFATADDLVARWRPLSTAERARAEVLLGKASRLIRARVPGIDLLVGTPVVLPVDENIDGGLIP